MNNPWKLLSFILFVWGEISAAHSSSSCNFSKYDFTDILNDAIVRILKSDTIAEKLESLILVGDDRKYNGECRINTGKIPFFENPIDISGVRVIGDNFNGLRLDKNQHSTIRWEFPKNELRMLYSHLEYQIYGHTFIEVSNSFWNFNVKCSQIVAQGLWYRNLSVIATKSLAKQKDDENITIGIHWNHMTNHKGIRFTKKKRKISYKHHLSLLYLFSLEFPAIIRHVFNDGGNLRALLGKMFNLHPRQHIIAAFPDFPTNEQRYYYLIPDISIGFLVLKNITIRGLSNFESYMNKRTAKFHRYLSHCRVYTLRISSVQGNVTLDPGFDHLSRLQPTLSFSISNLDITYAPKTQKFRVKARDYFIDENSPKSSLQISSWLSKYSTSIMKLIELSIQDLLAPSKEDTEKSISSTPHLREMDTSFMRLLTKPASDPQ
ncbi:uncharacterized protein LOC135837102 [Planococcus citri]|uniref:uncharacterized protein LOC135837102 n=1 Tax=Planococcus citri TaxID=170843 RepID=UPI0031F7DD2C